MTMDSVDIFPWYDPQETTVDMIYERYSTLVAERYADDRRLSYQDCRFLEDESAMSSITCRRLNRILNEGNGTVSVNKRALLNNMLPERYVDALIGKDGKDMLRQALRSGKRLGFPDMVILSGRPEQYIPDIYNGLIFYCTADTDEASTVFTYANTLSYIDTEESRTALEECAKLCTVKIAADHCNYLLTGVWPHGINPGF